MLYYELYTIIASYCTHFNAVKLSIATNNKGKNYHHYTQYCIDSRSDIISEFKKMNIEKSERLMEIIEQNDGYISGSFMLKLLVGATWKSDDIDVYIDVTNGNYPDLINEILVNDTSNEEYNSFAGFTIGGYGDNNVQLHCRATKCGDVKIQFIFVTFMNKKGFNDKNNTIHEFINRTFDFDFCKNIYNSKTKKIITMYPDSLYSKSSDISKILVPTTKLERIIKYTKRGFTINNLDTYYKTFLSHHSINLISKIRTIQEPSLSTDPNSISRMMIFHYFGDTLSIFKCHQYNIGVNINKKKKHIMTTDAYTLMNTSDYNIIQVLLYMKMEINNFDDAFLEYQQNLLKCIHDIDLVRQFEYTCKFINDIKMNNISL
jgi:hypothetical protein